MTKTCLVGPGSALAVALLLAAQAVRAEDRVVVSDFSSAAPAAGAPPGWELSEKSGKADLAVVDDGGVSAVRFRSVSTSFSIQKEVKVDLRQFPMLTWKWKVITLPVGGDFRKPATDDQAAQLFVAFSKSKAIVYVWSSTVPKGLMQGTTPAPFTTVKLVVMRSGPLEKAKWVHERRNVYRDYKKFFGSEPPTVYAMRLQINSQHTETSAESYFADLAFEKAGKPGAKDHVAPPK